MNWFKRSYYSVCEECEVHFEPATGGDVRWGHLCQTHRKAVRARDEQKDAVVSWAKRNWERLAPMMLEEEKKTYDAYRAAFSSSFEQQPFAAQQQAAAQFGGDPSYMSNLGVLGKGLL